MLLNLVLPYYFYCAFQVSLSVQCYSDLTKTALSNDPAYFVPELDVEHFLETLEVLEIEDMAKAFIGGHIHVDRGQLADVVHPTILSKNSELIFEPTGNGNTIYVFLGSFLYFLLLLLDLNFCLFNLLGSPILKVDHLLLLGVNLGLGVNNHLVYLVAACLQSFHCRLEFAEVLPAFDMAHD